jgi:cytochrome c oxidase cbb3-type subunit 4
MDLDMLRSAATLLSFLAFAGIVVWAMSPRKKAAFDEAERLPFLESAERDDIGEPIPVRTLPDAPSAAQRRGSLQ